MPRRPSASSPTGKLCIVVVLVLLLAGARTIASYTIVYEWWQEMGQLDAWLTTLYYGLLPAIAAPLLALAVFWIAHARGVEFAGASQREFPAYARFSPVV